MRTTPTPVAVAKCDTDLDNAQLITEVLAAITDGYDLEDYLAARTYGIADAELRSAPRCYPLAEYAAALAAGATRPELAQLALKVPGSREHLPTRLAGIFTLYTNARTHAVPHADLVDAVTYSVPLNAYVEARLAGATHAEVADYRAQPDGTLLYYARARSRGATHAGLLAASALNLGELYYASALEAGITHTELMQVADLGREQVFDYVTNRRVGYDHATALATQEDYLQSPTQD